MNISKQNNFGLSAKTIDLIITTLNQFPQIERAVIFGSRAKGNYKNGSDIDIAIYGKEINFDLIVRLGSILNEDLPIPYKVDIINYEILKNKELKKRIEQEGKTIFSR